MGTRLELSLLCFAIFILCNSQGSLSISLYPQGFNITTMARPPLPHYPETHTLLAPILTNLGYTELAMAVPYLYDSYLSSWAGPATLFAIDDQAIRSCSRCSRPQILKEHIIPGLFTYHHLSKLAHGTKIQTMSSDRCITVTSMNSTENTTNVLIDGVQITHPDLFNDALLAIHGLDGFVFPLSPQSCFSQENSTQFPENYTSPFTYLPENYTCANTNSTLNHTIPLPYSPENYTSPGPHLPENHTSPLTYSPGNYTTRSPARRKTKTPSLFPNNFPAITMRSSLGDAMLRLRSSGFSIVGLALRIKYGELVGLQNMTVFALDDRSILNGGYAYVHNVRFHIVPDRYLKGSDLAQLHMGSILQTLVSGQDLVVTNPGSVRGSLRINFVPLKGCDVMYDSRILVHSIFVPFPRFGVWDWMVPNAYEDGLFHETGSVLEKDGLLPEVQSTAWIAPEGHVAGPEMADEGL
ncbi:uncharacterized protein LOC18439254 [Amborella trichopoda]|uniref:uncharacterized protein LOC18439254 n=1 Tax=Amborella trichopoda TaxID=13333 RepID=UPI0009C0D67D|nr:uncharacterized protein LOC18439254 [Amborella trichopoda]|eukprot:XP_020526106.1 uncharacterized protein LOC18439254 [Amborella trichopoda]